MTVKTWSKTAGLRLSDLTGAHIFKNCQDVQITGGKLSGESWSGALYFQDCEKVVLDGVRTLGSAFGGITLRNTNDVTIQNPHLYGDRVGLTCLDSSKIVLRGGMIAGFAIDGMDIASTRDVLVEYVTFTGGLLTDAHHPDCLQIWSNLGSQLSEDIIIRKCLFSGSSQGASGFGKPAGSRRVTIEDNVAILGFPHAFSLFNSPDSLIQRNVVHTLPGAQFQAKINFDATIAHKGNIVNAGAGKKAWAD